MLAFKGKPRKPRRPLHFGLVAFGITLARARSEFEFQGGTVVQINIVGTLFHIFAMSAIKWHVRFVDCSLIYANFQRLFVFKMFEFGANFGPKWFSLGFEFETIYGKICKKMNNPTKNQLSYFGWVGEIMSWSENY